MRSKEEFSKGPKKRQKNVMPVRNQSRADRHPEKTGSTDLEQDQVFLQMGSWELDLASGILHCSPDLQKLLEFGLEEKKVSLNDYLEKIHPDDRRTFLLEIEQTTAEQTSFTQTVRYLPKAEKLITTLTKGEPRLDGKKPVKITGLVLEIVSVPDQTASNYSKEESYRLLFELSPSGIILENRRGIIIDANPSFCRAMGYRREELTGRHVHILAHPEVREQVDTHIAQLLAGRVLKHNVKSLRKDGSICFMELSETKITLPNGEEGILCIAEDYTDRLRAQEEQLQKEKFRGTLEMAGAVCHELNQPLTTIFITTDLLLDFPKQPNLKEMMTIIKNEAIRIGKLTDKLMRITKYETRDYINGQKIVDIDKAAGEHR